MKYKLKDVKNVIKKGVQFGTCELCEYIGTLEYDIMIFEDENGNEYEAETGTWNWGVYDYIYTIPNYIHFAEYVSSTEFSAPQVSPSGMILFREVFQDEIYPSYMEKHPEQFDEEEYE